MKVKGGKTNLATSYSVIGVILIFLFYGCTTKSLVFWWVTLLRCVNFHAIRETNVSRSMRMRESERCHGLYLYLRSSLSRC